MIHPKILPVRPLRRLGVTLVEIMIAALVLGLFLAMLYQVFYSSGKGFNRQAWQMARSREFESFKKRLKLDLQKVGPRLRYVDGLPVVQTDEGFKGLKNSIKISPSKSALEIKAYSEGDLEANIQLKIAHSGNKSYLIYKVKQNSTFSPFQGGKTNVLSDIKRINFQKRISGKQTFLDIDILCKPGGYKGMEEAFKWQKRLSLPCLIP